MTPRRSLAPVLVDVSPARMLKRLCKATLLAERQPLLTQLQPRPRRLLHQLLAPLRQPLQRLPLQRLPPLRRLPRHPVLAVQCR